MNLYKTYQKNKRLIYYVPLEENDNPKCRCVHSGEIFNFNDGVIIGSVLPQSNMSFLCHPDFGSITRKESVIALQELDKNCNTCKNLCRIEYRDSFGFLKGNCTAFDSTHPYNRESFFYFHPDDFMGMNCWQSRN